MFELYPELDVERQKLALSGVGDEYHLKRRVILAHGMAESSLTLVDIDFVVDCGYEELNGVYNNELGPFIYTSGIIGCDSWSLAQRKGRLARIRNYGKMYRLYPESFKHTNEFKSSELWQTDLIHLVLYMRILETSTLDFPNYLPIQNMIQSIETLKVLGIFGEDGDITQLGMYVCSILPILNKNIQLSLILSHVLMEFSNENMAPIGLWTVCSFIAVRMVRDSPSFERDNTGSDYLTYYNLTCGTRSLPELSATNEWRNRIINFIENLFKTRFKGYKSFQSDEKMSKDEKEVIYIKKIILKALRLNVAKHNSCGNYTLLRYGTEFSKAIHLKRFGWSTNDEIVTNCTFRISPDSIYHNKNPNLIVFEQANSLPPTFLTLIAENSPTINNTNAWQRELDYLHTRSKKKKPN